MECAKVVNVKMKFVVLLLCGCVCDCIYYVISMGVVVVLLCCGAVVVLLCYRITLS